MNIFKLLEIYWRGYLFTQNEIIQALWFIKGGRK